MANVLRVNDKTDNPKLTALMDKYKDAFKNDKKAAAEILGQIADELALRARLLVPVILSDEPVSENGKLVVKDNTNVTFMLLHGGENDIIPVFTNNAEYEKWNVEGTERPYSITLDFDSLASVLESGAKCWGIVVNPFSDNLQIPRTMALNWFEQKQIHAKGHARHVITSDTPADVYTPDPYPMVLSNKICEAAKGLSGVKALWLRGVRLNGADGYLLIADITEDGNKVIFPTLGEAAKPHLNGLPLHIVTADSDFGKSSTNNVLPVYSKKE